MTNHCSGRYQNLDLEEMYTNDDDMDTIEIDIDTQRIMVTRSNDSGNIIYDCDENGQPKPTNSPTKMLRPVKMPNTSGCYHVMIEDFRGKKNRILLFESNFIVMEELKTEIIQQNDTYYLFIFSGLNYIEGEKRKTYIILRKLRTEVDQLVEQTKFGINKKEDKFN